MGIVDSCLPWGSGLLSIFLCNENLTIGSAPPFLELHHWQRLVPGIGRHCYCRILPPCLYPWDLVLPSFERLWSPRRYFKRNWVLFRLKGVLRA